MHIVVLLNQSADGSTHRNHIIIRMRREYDYSLREWVGTLRTIGIVGIWLSAWPSGDGVLQIIENLDVCIVGRTIESQEFAQSVLIVILVGELQDRLTYLLAEPDQSRAYQLVCPLARSYEPRMFDAGKMRSSTQVEHYVGIWMSLEERCWQ